MASRYRTRATTMPLNRRRGEQRQRERRRQRWVFGLIALVLTLVVAIPAYGYVQTFVLPPRHVVLSVNGQAHTLGEIAKRTRADVLAATSFGADPLLASLPFEVVNTLTNEELFRQGASAESIVITQDDIDAEIRDLHYPKPPAGETADEAALEQEFQESLRNYLNLTQFSTAEYNNIVKANVIRERLREKLSAQIPTVAEQVYAHWIHVSELDQATEITTRLAAGESFDSLARIYMRSDAYADANGEVGWVPRGAFPGLDGELFEIEQGVVSEPIVSGSGTYIVKVTDGPITAEITDKMREVMKTRALDTWLNAQRSESNVQVTFTNTDYSWVIEKVRELLPTT